MILCNRIHHSCYLNNSSNHLPNRQEIHAQQRQMHSRKKKMFEVKYFFTHRAFRNGMINKQQIFTTNKCGAFLNIDFRCMFIW